MMNKRDIFVIMPFSSTASCTSAQWLEIYENVFKPAIEASGYSCNRATPTTGSLIKSIVNNLHTAYVVLADLTDRSPNVFYELGVRHALSKRTIIVAQHEEYIPSDLKGYWCIIYGTSPGQVSEFKDKIAKVVTEIQDRPEYSDNPVSDYLDHKHIDIMWFTAKDNVKKLGALITELTANINTMTEILQDPKYVDFLSIECLSLLLNTLYVDPGACILSDCYELRHKITGIKLGHRLDDNFISTTRDAANRILKSIMEIHKKVSLGKFDESAEVSTVIWEPFIQHSKNDVTAYSRIVGLTHITAEEVRKHLSSSGNQ